MINNTKKKSYKYCIVPKCTNTSTKTPEKYFFSVPKDKKVRKAWISASRRQHKLSDNTNSGSVCQDHFEFERDLKNYRQYTLMGNTVRPVLNSTAVPSKFECQGKSNSTGKRNTSINRINKNFVSNILQESNCNRDEHTQTTLPTDKPSANGAVFYHAGETVDGTSHLAEVTSATPADANDTTHQNRNLLLLADVCTQII